MSIDYKLLKEKLSQKGIDLDVKADKLGRGIEEKIKPLLLVLNDLGYHTSASCEGHSLDEFKKRIQKTQEEYHFEQEITEEDKYHIILKKKFGQMYGNITFDQSPWVHLEISDEQVKNLNSIINEYNKLNNIPCTLEKLEKSYRLSFEYTHSDVELQQEIPKLAEFIYNKSI